VVSNVATVEERPSTPPMPDLIYPYPRGSASGSSASEGRLPSPYLPKSKGRRRHRWGGDGRREQGSLPVGDRDGRGTWGRSGDVKLGREYDVWEPASDGLGMYNPQMTGHLQNLNFSIKTNILKTHITYR
jgi:hypothetical protein